MLTAEWFVSTYKPELSRYKNICVAYSGGVDSHVLLHLALSLGARVRAVHINHQQSKFDTELQQHCQKICSNLNIKLECIAVNIQQHSKFGPEAAARQARRNAWKQLLGSQDVLLLAHHAQDQAETVLLRLLRGTGPAGIAGIRKHSRLGTTTILRPLLNISKEHINTYAQQQQLEYLPDPDNSNNDFDRNYLRNTILPLLVERWPAALANIKRAAELCAAQEQYLEPLIATHLAQLQDTDLALDLRGFSTQPLSWQHVLLRAWLQQFGLVPSHKQLQLILQQVINARDDAMPEYVLGAKIIKRAKQSLYVLNAVVVPDATTYIAPWNLQEELELPNGAKLNVASLAANQDFVSKLATTQVTVRLGTHGRKAKKVFQQYAIPPWQRHQYPLIFADNRLVAIVGLWNSQRF